MMATTSDNFECVVCVAVLLRPKTADAERMYNVIYGERSESLQRVAVKSVIQENVHE